MQQTPVSNIKELCTNCDSEVKGETLIKYWLNSGALQPITITSNCNQYQALASTVNVLAVCLVWKNIITFSQSSCEEISTREQSHQHLPHFFLKICDISFPGLLSSHEKCKQLKTLAMAWLCLRAVKYVCQHFKSSLRHFNYFCLWFDAFGRSQIPLSPVYVLHSNLNRLQDLNEMTHLLFAWERIVIFKYIIGHVKCGYAAKCIFTGPLCF